MKIADLRKSYERDSLDEGSAGDDPHALFERWMQQALDSGVPEPNAGQRAFSTRRAPTAAAS